MDSKSKYLLKNTSILTISNFSSKILVFLLVPLYTSVLNTTEYGIYEIIMSTIQLLVPFLTLNIADGVLRFMMDTDAKKEQIKSIGLIFVIISTVLFFIIIVVNYVFDIWNILSEYSLETFLYYVFYVFNQLFIQTAKGEGKVKELAIAGVISTFVSLIANILLLVVIPLGLRGFFCAYILGQLSSTLYLLFKINFLKDLTFKFDKTLIHEILNYSLPLIFATLGWLINNVSDRYVVAWMCGIDQNGIYSVSYKIPTIITTIQNIFIQAWTISAIKEYKSKERDFFYENIFLKLNALMCCCCSALIISTKILARFLYAKDFYAAWRYVPFLLVSVVFGASSGFIGPILSAEKNSKDLAKSTFYGALANLIMNFALIYHIGVQGAAIATALSNVVIYVLRQKAIRGLLINKKYKIIIISWILISSQATLMICDLPIMTQLPLIVGLIYLYREIIRDTIYKAVLKIKG